jgi:hypothetical protein
VLGSLSLWLAGAFLFSVTNPLILLGGIGCIAYQCARAQIRQRELQRLIARRRAAGCCVFCGTPADPAIAFCTRCGEEPDPDSSRLERVARMINRRNNAAHARAILTPQPPAASAAAREQAMLARRQASQRRHTG